MINGRPSSIRESVLSMETLMNHHLLWLIAIILLTTAGCPPRHPPHTPQPFGMNAATGGSVSVSER
jgi:hypothetical protein